MDATGNVTGVAEGTAVITAESEGQSTTATITVSPIPVASVEVSPATASVEIGERVQLTATVRDAGGNVLSDRVVSWSSSNTSRATVNTNGRVTGQSVGTVTITATSEGKSGTATVTVTEPPPPPVASVELSPSAATIEVGENVQLTATVRDAAGNVLTDRVVSWSSSNTSLATVNSSGRVTGQSPGTVTITATSEGKSGTATVEVTDAPPPPVASVEVSPSSTTVQVGNTVQLTATLRDASGSVLTGRVLTWSSSNTSVATVNSSGRVTGQSAGTATITATSEGQSGTATVTVTEPPPPVASVEVSPSTASIVVGEQLQLTATLRDASGSVLTGRVLTWSSSNTSVATVNSSGRVTGQSAGTVTITATSEGQSGTATVTVTLPPVASVEVSPSSTTVQVGNTVQLTATLRDAAGNVLTGRVVDWSSSNTSVATVNSNGRVTGQSAGTATITATSEGQSGAATVAVTEPPPPVASVEVSPSSTTVQVGNTVQLTATVRDASGNVLTGRAVTWSSSNTSVATVNSGGLVTGRGAGTATMTATSEGQSGTATIQVTDGGGGGAPVLLESSWNYTTGTSMNAIGDGPAGSRKFPDSYNSGPGGGILEVMASGGLYGTHPGGNNALTADEYGGQYDAFSWVRSGWNPTSGRPKDAAMRFYFRVNGSVGGQPDHHTQQGVESAACYLESVTYETADLAGGFSLKVLYNYSDNGQGWVPSNGSTEQSLSRSTWYRVESLWKFNSGQGDPPYQWRLFARIYSVDAGTLGTTAAGSLLYDWTDFGDVDDPSSMLTSALGNPPTGWATSTPTGCPGGFPWNGMAFGMNGQALRGGVNTDEAYMWSAVKIVDATNLNQNSPVWVGDLSGQ